MVKFGHFLKFNKCQTVRILTCYISIEAHDLEILNIKFAS